MINVGYIAKTYGLLPSEVLSRATTYDLMITDVLNSWEKYQLDKSRNKVDSDSYSQEELKKMLEKSRGG